MGKAICFTGKWSAVLTCNLRTPVLSRLYFNYEALDQVYVIIVLSMFYAAMNRL